MKQRAHTWLGFVAGALALPLLALCSPLFASTPSLSTHDLVLSAAGTHALHEDAAPLEGTLMSCADADGNELPLGGSTSPLWCENNSNDPRCAPAAPEPRRPDLGHASPALIGPHAPFTPPPASFVLVTQRASAHEDTLHGRAHHTHVDRPPRA